MIAGYRCAILMLPLAGCASFADRECKLPPLSDQKISEIAVKYLQSKNTDPVFFAKAETRVQAYGCRYSFEASEKLDSLGAGIIVVVSRSGKVFTTFGSN